MGEETIFEGTLDQLQDSINRINDLMDEAELSEMESYYCTELKMKCQEFIDLCDEKMVADEAA